MVVGDRGMLRCFFTMHRNSRALERTDEVPFVENRLTCMHEIKLLVSSKQDDK